MTRIACDIMRPQTLDLLVLAPAMDIFWRSWGDGKIKKNSKIVLLLLELGFLTLDSVGKKSIIK